MTGEKKEWKGGAEEGMGRRAELCGRQALACHSQTNYLQEQARAKGSRMQFTNTLCGRTDLCKGVERPGHLYTDARLVGIPLHSSFDLEECITVNGIGERRAKYFGAEEGLRRAEED